MEDWTKASQVWTMIPAMSLGAWEGPGVWLLGEVYSTASSLGRAAPESQRKLRNHWERRKSNGLWLRQLLDLSTPRLSLRSLSKLSWSPPSCPRPSFTFPQGCLVCPTAGWAGGWVISLSAWSVAKSSLLKACITFGFICTPCWYTSLQNYKKNKCLLFISHLVCGILLEIKAVFLTKYFVRKQP